MKSKKYMLSKASFSSLSGWPIAFALNIMILPSFAYMLIEDILLASILIGLIFGLVSVFRLFIIDFVEDRYGLNVRPDHLIRKLLNR